MASPFIRYRLPFSVCPGKKALTVLISILAEVSIALRKHHGNLNATWEGKNLFPRHFHITVLHLRKSRQELKVVVCSYKSQSMPCPARQRRSLCPPGYPHFGFGTAAHHRNLSRTLWVGAPYGCGKTVASAWPAIVWIDFYNYMLQR